MTIATVAGGAIVLLTLLDAFETVVLPRSVHRRWRLATLFLRLGASTYRLVGRLPWAGVRRPVLNAFGPSLLLGLIALWATLLVLGFALVQWGLESALRQSGAPVGFGALLYFSGVTFFTVGYGDIAPADGWGRAVSVLEAGTGFAFLGLAVSYVPVLYGAFSRREVRLLLLDGKAGSNPTAAELLRRHAQAEAWGELTRLLADWELFAAELLEAYLSYPVLAFYRSQHDEQSWLTSLTAVMDACALILAAADVPGAGPALRFQAQATYSMARHLLVDLAYVLDAAPEALKVDRLGAEQYAAVHDELLAHGLRIDEADGGRARLDALRARYEPYSLGLARALVLWLPEWIAAERVPDNWERSAWLHF